MTRPMEGIQARRGRWAQALLLLVFLAALLALAAPMPAWAESEGPETCGYAYLEDNDDRPDYFQSKTLVIDTSAREGESGFVRLGPVLSDGYGNYQDIPWQAHGEVSSITKVRFEGAVSPRSMAHWFENCSVLDHVSFDGLDGSRVASVAYMFQSCEALTDVDLSGFRASSVVDMASMFKWCSNLKTVNASGFITSSADDLSGMFSACKSLEQVDLTGCDFSNVGLMESMFIDCSSLQTLDLSACSFVKVRDVGRMFCGCVSLKELKLPEAKTVDGQRTVLAKWLFYDCRSLERADLRFLGDASFLEDAGDMFLNCYALQAVQVDAGFAAEDVFRSMLGLHAAWTANSNAQPVFSSSADMVEYARSSAFATSFMPSFGDGDVLAIEDASDHSLRIRTGCRDLAGSETLLGAVVGGGVPWESRRSTFERVVVENRVVPASTAGWFEDFALCSSIEGLRFLDMSNVVDMSEMFAGCVVLGSIDLSGFKTSSVETFRGMFESCRSLSTLDLRSFNTAQARYMQWMFAYCSSLEKSDLSSFTTSNVTDMRGMFCDCGSLRELDLSGFDTEKVEDMGYMFSGCASPDSFEISRLNTGSVVSFTGMFGSCKMRHIDLSWLDTSRGAEFSYMFKDCDQLEGFSLRGFDFTKAATAYSMFAGCQAMTSFDFASADLGELGEQRGSAMFDSCAQLEVVTRSPGAKVPGYLMPKGMWLAEGADVVYRSDRIPEANETGDVQTFRKVSDDLRLHATLSLDSGEFVVDSTVPDASRDGAGVKVFAIGDESRYDEADAAPWHEYRAAIRSVRIVDMASAKSAKNWFNGCENLRSVEWEAPRDRPCLDNMANMFAGCVSLGTARVPLPGNSTAVYCSGMFSGCLKLQEAEFTRLDDSLFSDGAYWPAWAFTDSMFDGCPSLRRVAFPDEFRMRGSAVRMFRGCSSLETIGTSGFDVHYVTDFSEMFRSCSSLTELDLSSFDTTRGQVMKRMLHGCTSLGKVSLGSRFTFWGGAYSRLPGSELPSGAWQAVDSTGAPLDASRAYAADSLPNFTAATYVRVDEETPGLTIESVRGDTDDGSSRYTVETQVVELDDGTLEAQSDYVLGDEFDPEGGEFVIGDAAKASSTKTLTAKSITQQSVRSVSSNKNVHTVVIGSQVKSVKADAFSKAPNVTALKVKSPKLTTKASMQNCLRGSKVSRVTISLSSASARVNVANAFAKWSGKKAARR